MKWEENYDEKSTIMNVKLMKIIGVYHLLNPNRPRIFGYNIFHIIVVVAMVYETIMLTFCLIGVFYWKNNISHLVLQLIIFSNVSLGFFKLLTIATEKRSVRNCVEAASNDFLKYQFYDNVFFEKYRSKSITVTSVYLTSGFVTLVLWSACSFVFSESYVILINPKGEWHSYHLNVLNVFFAGSSDLYNGHFIIFHILEMLCIGIFVIWSHMFDNLTISMCYTISSNLATIGNAFGTLSEKYATTSKYVPELKNPKVKLEILNDLNTIIADHQKVLKKMEDFYDIIRPVIFCQLVISSLTIVLTSFDVTLNVKIGVREETSVIILKIFCAFLFFVFQLCLTCYLFQCINKEKYAINHAIYCCGWEEMDIDCQKLILLAMKMNNSHKVLMKITDTKIVNLKMFADLIATGKMGNTDEKNYVIDLYWNTTEYTHSKINSYSKNFNKKPHSIQHNKIIISL